jgi:hypothetical protein
MSLKNNIITQINLGPLVKLGISEIENAGIGVFALTDIPKYTIVFKASQNQFIQWGEIETNEATMSHIKSVCNNNDIGFWIDCLLNQVYPAYYVNHSEDPNLFHDLNSDIYFSTRDINQGEELTCFYIDEEIDWD